ncbi:NUDIX hydrolase [Flindersiella endophytica]
MADDGHLVVVAAAVVRDRRLLVVSKSAAPEMFYLPGGKPDPGETPEQTLRRELLEELGAKTTRIEPFAVVEEVAALERVPMRMTVYLADLDRGPKPAAEIADLAWIGGPSDVPGQLAPAVHHHVMPRLTRAGLLGPG